jgi:nitrogen regulatory protein PII
MKQDLIISDPVGKWLKYHKWGKRCVGRFFTTTNDMIAISVDTLEIHKVSNFGNQEEYVESFKTKHFREQEMIITSFCKKCCKDIIDTLLKNAKQEAVDSSLKWFASQRKITLIRK